MRVTITDAMLRGVLRLCRAEAARLDRAIVAAHGSLLDPSDAHPPVVHTRRLDDARDAHQEVSDLRAWAAERIGLAGERDAMAAEAARRSAEVGALQDAAMAAGGIP